MNTKGSYYSKMVAMFAMSGAFDLEQYKHGGDMRENYSRKSRTSVKSSLSPKQVKSRKKAKAAKKARRKNR